mgnify:CR=1 FL=1
MSYKCRIELILGPMYSGKSTELIRRTSRYKAIGKNILIINSILDTRTDNSVKTHSNNKKKAIKTKNLLDIVNLDDYKNSEVIGVDEGQFFDDLLDFVKIVEQTDKILIIAGLDGDYKREPFGDILRCIPLCDDLIKLSAMCMYKNNGTPSSFTKRIVNSDNQTLIGAKNTYITVCREGYFNTNE